jgi:DNA-directed RNA polymerase subunit F
MLKQSEIITLLLQKMQDPNTIDNELIQISRALKKYVPQEARQRLNDMLSTSDNPTRILAALLSITPKDPKDMSVIDITSIIPSSILESIDNNLKGE